MPLPGEYQVPGDNQVPNVVMTTSSLRPRQTAARLSQVAMPERELSLSKLVPTVTLSDDAASGVADGDRGEAV